MKKSSNFNKFLLLWFGELISSIGGGLTSFGLSVYIFNTTGSAANMALVMLLSSLPLLILGMPAGVLADRYDRRNLMMIGDGLSAIGVIYILICMFNGGATLLQICIGILISAIFSSLLEPSYKATMTDLLSKDEYSRASGMMGIAGGARYLISPLIAGLLLSVSDIKLLLIIDICTFILTILTTRVVKNSIKIKKIIKKEGFLKEFRTGWKVIASNKGLVYILVISSLVTFFIGTFQILAEPLVLDFTTSKILGICETICASGMIVSGIYLGVKGIKRGYVKILSRSLLLAGFGMIIVGLKENIYLICVSGFFFFFMLPFVNNCLDYLVRINVLEEYQGRVWSIISVVSQIGYVVAYAISGILADKTSLIMESSIGRSSGAIISIAGMLLLITGIIIYFIKPIKELENN